MFEILYDTKNIDIYPLLVKKCCQNYNASGRGFYYFQWGAGLIKDLNNIYEKKLKQNKQISLKDIWGVIEKNGAYIPKFILESEKTVEEAIRFQEIMSALRAINETTKTNNFMAKYKPNIEALVIHDITYAFVEYIKKQFNIDSTIPAFDEIEEGESRLQLVKINKFGEVNLPKETLAPLQEKFKLMKDNL